MSIDLQLHDLARVTENMFNGVGNNALGRAANSSYEQFEQRLITGTPSEDAKYEGAAARRDGEIPAAFVEYRVI